MTNQKSLSIFSLLLIFACNCLGQTSISSEIKNVTVFLSGAEINRSTEVDLKKGRNLIVLKGLSPSLLKASLRIEPSTDVDIMATSHSFNYLTEEIDNDLVRTIKDSIEFYSSKVDVINNDVNAYQIEKKLLEQNIQLSGKQQALSMTTLKEAANYYRVRIKDINKRTYELQKEAMKFKKTEKKYRNQLSELNSSSNDAHSEIAVTIDAAQAGKTKLDIFYLVTDAGWSSTYEIKAVEMNAPISIYYNANVFNNAGFDWKDVNLKVSTGEPNLTASRPDLERWTINKRVYRRRQKGGWNVNADNGGFELDKDGISSSLDVFDNNQFNSLNIANNKKKYGGKKNQTVKFKQIVVSELSKTFDIAKTYTIPSNAKPYIIKVTKYDVPAKYSYISVPKLDRDAFLIAQIANWEDLDLVEGPAQVYFGNNYVGKSYINTQNAPDTLELSLGRDNNIAITRVKKKEFSSKRIIGANKKDSYVFEIQVKNSRDISVDIKILDQIPVSNDSEVSLSVNETSNAKYDEAEGLLTWSYTLNPKESKKITLGFTVKYPKNKRLNMKKFTPVSCPSF